MIKICFSGNRKFMAEYDISSQKWNLRFYHGELFIGESISVTDKNYTVINYLLSALSQDQE